MLLYHTSIFETRLEVAFIRFVVSQDLLVAELLLGMTPPITITLVEAYAVLFELRKGLEISFQIIVLFYHLSVQDYLRGGSRRSCDFLADTGGSGLDERFGD